MNRRKDENPKNACGAIKQRFDKARGRSGFRRHFDGGGNKWCNDVQCKVRQVGNLCSKLHSEVSQGITTELF